jgi:hypothetical protein
VKRLARRAATILWPAFLLAAVIEIAVFAFVDPMSFRTLGGEAVPLSATGVYSIAFLLFWALTAVACGLTVLLDRAADELNAPPATH